MPAAVWHCLSRLYSRACANGWAVGRGVGCSVGFGVFSPGAGGCDKYELARHWPCAHTCTIHTGHSHRAGASVSTMTGLYRKGLTDKGTQISQTLRPPTKKVSLPSNASAALVLGLPRCASKVRLALVRVTDSLLKTDSTLVDVSERPFPSASAAPLLLAMLLSVSTSSGGAAEPVAKEVNGVEDDSDVDDGESPFCVVVLSSFGLENAPRRKDLTSRVSLLSSSLLLLLLPSSLLADRFPPRPQLSLLLNSVSSEIEPVTVLPSVCGRLWSVPC